MIDIWRDTTADMCFYVSLCVLFYTKMLFLFSSKSIEKPPKAKVPVEKCSQIHSVVAINQNNNNNNSMKRIFKCAVLEKILVSD